MDQTITDAKKQWERECERDTQQWISERSAYELKISRINDELSKYKQKLDFAVSEALMFQKHAEDSKLDYRTKMKTFTEKYKELSDIVMKYDRQMGEFEEKMAEMYKQSAASLVNNHGSVTNLPQSFQESDLPGKLHILEKIMKEKDAKLRELEKIIQEQKEILKKVSEDHNDVADSDGSVTDFECYHGDLSEASPEKLREHNKKLESVPHKTKQNCYRKISDWIVSFYSCIRDRVSERKTYKMKISTINDDLSECKQKLDFAVSEALMFQKHAEDSKLVYQTKMKIFTEKYKELSDILVKYDRQMGEFEEKMAEMYKQSAASLVNKHSSVTNLPQSFQESDLPGKLHILEKIMKEKDAKLRELEKIIQEHKEILKKVSENHNDVADCDGSVTDFECYHGDLSEASHEKLREHIKKLESVLHTTKQNCYRKVSDWNFSFFSCIRDRVSERKTYEMKISTINDELSECKQKLDFAVSEALMFQKHAEDSKLVYQTKMKIFTEKYKELSDILVKYDRQMGEFEEKMAEMYKQSAASLVNKHGSVTNLPQSFQESDLPGKLHILEKIMKEKDAKLRELEKIIQEHKEILKKVSENHNDVADCDGSVTDFECYHGDLSEASHEKLREHIKKLESVLHTTKQNCYRKVNDWIDSFYSCIRDRVSERKTYEMKISTINDELSECKQKLDFAVSEALMFQKHAEDSKLVYQTKMKIFTEKYKELSDILVKYDRQMGEFEEKMAEMYKQSAASLVNKHSSVTNLPQSFQESDLPGKLHILEKIMKEKDAKLRELEKIIQEHKEILKKVSENHNDVADCDGSVTDFECYHGDLSEASHEKLREHIKKLESVLHTTKQNCYRKVNDWIDSFYSCIRDRVSERKTYEMKISTINDELSECKQKLDFAVSEALMFQKHAEDSKLVYQTKMKIFTEKYKELSDILVKYDRQMGEFEEKMAEMYKQSAASLVNKHSSVTNLPQSFQESGLPGKLHILEKIMKEKDAKLRELEKIIQEHKEILKKVSENHNDVADCDGSVTDFECYHGDLSEASHEKLREHIKKLESVLHTTKQNCYRKVNDWIDSFYSCIRDRVSERKTYEMKISTINDELSECKQKLDFAVSETLMFQKHAEDSKLVYQTKMKIFTEKYKELSDILVKYDRQMGEFEEKMAEMYKQSAASLVNKHSSVTNLPQSFQESGLPGKLHILEKIMKEKDAKLRELEKIIQDQKEILKKVSENHNDVADSDGSVIDFECYHGDLSEASHEKLREHIKKLESVLHTTKQNCYRKISDWNFSFFSCIRDRVSERKTYEMKISTINDELSECKQKLDFAVNEALMFQKHAEDSKLVYQTKMKIFTEKYKELSDILVKYDRQMGEFEKKMAEMYKQSAASLVNKHGSVTNLPQSFQESDLPGKLHILGKIVKEKDAKLRELEKMIQEQKKVVLKKVSGNHNHVADSECYQTEAEAKLRVPHSGPRSVTSLKSQVHHLSTGASIPAEKLAHPCSASPPMPVPVIDTEEIDILKVHAIRSVLSQKVPEGTITALDEVSEHVKSLVARASLESTRLQ